MLILWVNLFTPFYWWWNKEISWEEFKAVRLPHKFDPTVKLKSFPPLNDGDPHLLLSYFSTVFGPSGEGRRGLTSKKDNKRLSIALNEAKTYIDHGKSPEKSDMVFSILHMFLWGLNGDSVDNVYIKKIEEALNKYLLKPSKYTRRVLGDMKYTENALKAAICLTLMAKNNSEKGVKPFKKFKKVLYWLGYNVWAYKARVVINLGFDWSDFKCSPTVPLKEVTVYQKNLVCLAEVEKCILGKTTLLSPFQRLPQFIILSSPYKSYYDSKGYLPKYLLGALNRFNNYTGGDHGIKTLSSNHEQVLAYLTCLFGKPLQEGSKVPIYQSPGSNRFLAFSKANKVVYKWTAKGGSSGGVITVWGNNGPLHSSPNKGIIPHHFSLWVWNGSSPSNGKWVARDIKCTELGSADLPQRNCEQMCSQFHYDQVWCHVINEGLTIRFQSGGFIKVTSKSIAFYSKLDSPVWVHSHTSTHCFHTYKEFIYADI